MTVFTRRNMLRGAAVAATAVGSASLTTAEAADDPQDVKLFVKLSSALTGIAEGRLAPSVDPIQIRNQYYAQAKSDPGFDGVMKPIRDNPSDPAAAAAAVMKSADPAVLYLARSIILAWYLGAWYAPATLQRYNSKTPQPFPVPAVKVISPAAYTQGWTWRVAQTHPMGYSDFRFGYWSEDPPKLEDFIS